MGEEKRDDIFDVVIRAVEAYEEKKQALKVVQKRPVEVDSTLVEGSKRMRQSNVTPAAGDDVRVVNEITNSNVVSDASLSINDAAQTLGGIFFEPASRQICV